MRIFEERKSQDLWDTQARHVDWLICRAKRFRGGFLSALSKHLVWTPAAAPASQLTRARPALAVKVRGAKARVSSSAQLSESVGLDIALPPREQVIYLLHIGAEVEHALMVQYEN